MTSEMVERMAQAIEAERWKIAIEQVSAAFPPVSSIEGSRRTARAALQAMREPTAEMIEAGLRRYDHCTDGGAVVAPCVIEHSWPAMIDAALKEP